MMTRHDRGAFVPKVDFICGAGHLDGGTSRTDRGLPEGGPKLVVTPLGVFDFEPRSKAMRIKSLHEGVTLDEVRDNTGFDLAIPETIARTVAENVKRAEQAPAPKAEGADAKDWEKQRRERVENVRLGVELEMARAFFRAEALDESEAWARRVGDKRPTPR